MASAGEAERRLISGGLSLAAAIIIVGCLVRCPLFVPPSFPWLPPPRIGPFLRLLLPEPDTFAA